MKKWTICVSAAISLFLCGCGATHIGLIKFPEPTATFQPKKTYESSCEEAWRTVKSICGTNRIPIVSEDEKSRRIITDYIEGEAQLVHFLGGTETRYKYNISLQEIEKDKVKIFIICSLEAMSNTLGETSPWHDVSNVSNDNKEIVTKLENWLYEKIENSL